MRYHSDRYLRSSLSQHRCLGAGRPSGLGKNALARMFRVQLNTKLLIALKPLATQIRSLGLMAGTLEGFPLETFGDLLSHPSPPLSLLRSAKNFAKHSESASIDPMPAEVSTSLYFSTIAAAILRLGVRITKLHPTELKEGLQWTSNQSWLDNAIRQLAVDAWTASDSSQ